MNLLRIVLDGLAMSAAFNLATGLIMSIRPAAFTTCYPKEIQKIASKNPTALRDKLLFGALVLVPVTFFGILSAYSAGIRGFWPLFWTAYLEWFLVNLGDFFGLDLLLREKMGARLELPGTEGHPCYTRANWMRSLAVPEHWIQWPLLVCPFFALISAGIGLLLP